MADPRWLDEREQHAWRATTEMHRKLSAAVERQLVLDSGLSAADYAVLVPLSESPGGVLRARDLARGAGWEKSRLSHQMRRMEQRGLVEREGCPTDARGAYVRLTPAGRRALEAAAPSHVETVRRLLFDQLTPAEVETLAAVADRILANLAEAGEEIGGCCEAEAGPPPDG
jgi:DNA-binding MarR family transcriptional regulator